MKVTILDKVHEMSNVSTSLEDIFQDVRTLTDNKEYILSHFVMDGIEIYDDFEEVLNDRIESINELKVLLYTSKEYTDALLLDASRYLMNAIPEVTQLANEFYKNPDTETWNKLAQLCEGLQWIDHAMAEYGIVRGNKDSADSLLSITEDYKGMLQELNQALEQKDHVLIADLLQYEIKVKLEQQLAQVANRIDNEVVRYDLS
jgi:hypothetical protein